MNYSDAEFLAVANDFQLGVLDTERPHPATKDLSRWARQDLPAGFRALRGVDRAALDILQSRLGTLDDLARAMRDTLDGGHRIFLCGCGATGRLSIALEVFARAGLLRGATARNITGFMAGGDTALIRSIERFEDRPDYGAHQLRELGFADGDLLIASTEGGETPFVIGAAEAAAEDSSRCPFFLYCNPDELLRAHVERSRRVIENDSIRKINFSVGPMALSGSTRMQASTVLMAAIGFAMKHADEPGRIADDFAKWKDWVLDEMEWTGMAAFTEAEAATYQAGDYVIYEPGDYSLTVLTDTTERSPTFTLTPFEREGSTDPAALCYLWIEGTASAGEAWSRILNRRPNPVEWGTLRHLTSGEAMRAFNFSDPGRLDREKRTGKPNHLFSVARNRLGIALNFRSEAAVFPVPFHIDFFEANLALKMLLNAHSTLIMGRLGRYEDNLMTYVSPNNFKLIDRSIRYVRELLKRHHHLEPAYEEVAAVLLAEKEKLAPNEPIVLKTMDAFLNKSVLIR